MAEETPIEWTGDPITGRHGSTWSPVTGCTDADPSCLWCYAKKLTATRLRQQPKYRGLARMGKRGPQWSGSVRLHPEILDQPFRWRGRRKIFVCSMSDLFHDDVPFDFIAQVWAAMALSYQHRGHLHLCLTKRTKRARLMLTGKLTGEDGEHFNEAVNRHFRSMIEKHGYSPWFAERDVEWPTPGIHLGMSAGRRKEAVERWRDLSHTPIQARFMSIEPMIESVSLFDVLSDKAAAAIAPDQVIAGFESGTRERCRPGHPYWIRTLKLECGTLGIPFFFKQWGNYTPIAPLYGEAPTQGALDAWSGTDPVVVDVEGNVWRDGDDGQPPRSAWLMAYTSKKSAGRKFRGGTLNGYPDMCSSCFSPFDSFDSSHQCPCCEGFVCGNCKVNDANEVSPCSGICRGCRKDGKLAGKSERI